MCQVHYYYGCLVFVLGIVTSSGRGFWPESGENRAELGWADDIRLAWVDGLWKVAGRRLVR